jgi:hypothetical protein
MMSSLAAAAAAAAEDALISRRPVISQSGHIKKETHKLASLRKNVRHACGRFPPEKNGKNNKSTCTYPAYRQSWDTLVGVKDTYGKVPTSLDTMFDLSWQSPWKQPANGVEICAEIW